MLFKVQRDDGRIVDWDRVIPPDVGKTETLLALEHLERAWRVMEVYTQQVHIPAAHRYARTRQRKHDIPSLIGLIHDDLAREHDEQGQDELTPQEFNEFIDSALLGLCNSMVMMLGEVRTSMMAHAVMGEFELPMFVEEEGGVFMPLKVRTEIQAKLEETAAELRHEMEEKVKEEVEAENNDG